MLSFFPRGVLDEILNLIGSVSEGCPSCSFIFRFYSRTNLGLLSEKLMGAQDFIVDGVKDMRTSCVVAVDRFRHWSVMLWGDSFSTMVKTDLVVIRGNLNAESYRDNILAPVVLLYINQRQRPTVFQHDDARPYTARLVTQFLTANNVDVMQ